MLKGGLKHVNYVFGANVSVNMPGRKETRLG